MALRAYKVDINGIEAHMMLDEEGAKLWPDAKPVEEAKAEKEPDAAVPHKARRPAKQAAPAREQ